VSLICLLMRSNNDELQILSTLVLPVTTRIIYTARDETVTSHLLSLQIRHTFQTQHASQVIICVPTKVHMSSRNSLILHIFTFML
jgi:hypothetical protein